MAPPMTAAERKRKQRALDAADPEHKQRKLDSLFMFGCVEIAALVDADDAVWFKAVDIARALEIEDPTAAMAHTVEQKYTQHYENLTLNSLQYRDIPNIHPKTTFVNEAGMNLFVLRSRKPKAEAFAEWVCAVVLPSIRKTGKYEVSAEEKEYKELNEFLKQQIEKMKVEMKTMSKKIDDKDTQLQSKEAQLQSKDAQLCRKDEQIDARDKRLFDLRPKTIVDNPNEGKDEQLILLRKFPAEQEPDDDDPASVKALLYPFYASRVQRDSIQARLKELRGKYPHIRTVAEYNLPNSVNFFNHVCDRMKGCLERGRGVHAQSFRFRDGLDEGAMLKKIDNIYIEHY